jgi:hypothetical protein
MIIVKLTILLTMVVAFLIRIFKGWCSRHPLEVAIDDYPIWTYIMSVLVILDVVGIFASVVWLLFFYW